MLFAIIAAVAATLQLVESRKENLTRRELELQTVLGEVGDLLSDENSWIVRPTEDRRSLDLARRVLERGFSIGIESSELYRYQAIYLAAIGEYKQAESKTLAALRLDSRNPGLYTLASHFALRRDDFVEAVEICWRGLQIAPKDGSLWNNIGVALRDLQASSPQSPMSEEETRLGELISEKDAETLVFLQPRLRLSEFSLQKAMSYSDPSLHISTENLVAMYRKHGKNNAAIAALQLTIKRGAPEYFDYYQLIQILEAEGRTVEARQLAAQAAEIFSDNPVASFNLAVQEHNGGDIHVAEAMYKRTIALDPEYVTPKLKLARIMIQRGDLADAEELLSEALVASPGRPATTRLMGLLNLVKGDYLVAAQWLEKCRTNKTDSSSSKGQNTDRIDGDRWAERSCQALLANNHQVLAYWIKFLSSNTCPLELESASYGRSPEEAIHVGGVTLGPGWQRGFLSLLKGKDGAHTEARRTGKAMGPCKHIVDKYAVLNEADGSEEDLYLCMYHFDSPRIPTGYECVPTLPIKW